jgi:hypothetical protein
MPSTLAHQQQQFLQAIYQHATQDERLSIYADNTRLTLIELLRSSYPVIDKIVGADFFTALARHYVQQYPQTQADRHQYGADLSAFLKTFAPAAQLAYLSDLATLEWAYHRAYFADDAQAMTFETLQALAAHGDDFSLPLHPSVQHITVDYNVLEIWQAHQQEDIPSLQLQHHTQHLLIWRDPQHNTLITIISTDLHVFLTRCTDSFLMAMQHVDTSAFQSEFANCLTQGLFIQQDTL